MSRIDALASEIDEAAARNHQRWGWGSFSSDVSTMKVWLTSRLAWIDTQFVRMPTLSAPSGPIDPGFDLSLSGTGNVYYTLDGSDPRAPGGAIAPGATRYAGVITLESNVMVVARSRSGTDWSGPAVGSYWVDVPRLVISELMYHPPSPLVEGEFGGDDFEFVELINSGTDPLDLEGFEFTRGIGFRFGPGAPLAPGDYVVIVENRLAFESRYGTDGIRIAGEYTGNLANSGETITLAGPLGEPVHDFEFVDVWFPETDGQGRSLVIIDPWSPLDSWADSDAWSDSSVLLGTPGTDDSGVGGRQFPGDSNQDGLVDISDALSILFRLFGDAGPLPCEGGLADGGNLVVLNVNGDGGVDITDAVYLLDWLFRGGPGPALGTQCLRVEGCPTTCGF